MLKYILEKFRCQIFPELLSNPPFFDILLSIMEKIVLTKRNIIGNKSKNLLKENITPAVIYNSKGESTNIQLDSKTAGQITREATSTTIYDIDMEGKSAKVVVKEIDFNPRTEELRHISFFEIDESKPMVFTIPFHIIGISPAVKNNLGVLIEALDSIEVRCLLSDLKPFIEIDISGLEHPGQSIAVEDIRLPDGMNLINEDTKKSTIITITEPQKEEEVIAPVAVEGEEDAVVEGEEGAEVATEETPEA